MVSGAWGHVLLRLILLCKIAIIMGPKRFSSRQMGHQIVDVRPNKQSRQMTCLYHHVGVFQPCGLGVLLHLFIK